MEAELADPERGLRSITIHYLAAAIAGPARIHVTVERVGRTVGTLTARLAIDGKVVALAIAAFAGALSEPLRYDDETHPQAGSPTDLRPPPEGALSPPFLRNFLIQPTIGPVPFAGVGPALTGGWIAPAAQHELDAPLVVALADTWWPSPFALLDTRVPAPTIELTVHIRAPLPLPPAPVLSEFRATLIRDGLFEEDGRLFAEDGMVLARSRQLAMLRTVNSP
jgi:hypothetical protein